MKKMLCRSVLLSAALSLFLTTIPELPVKAESVLKDSGLDYTESVSYDPCSFDCGYSAGKWINAAPGKEWSADITSYSLLLICIGEYSSGMNSSGTDYDLDSAFFKSLENTLKSARSNGYKVGIRLRYDAEGASNPEPMNFEQVLNHVEQLGESGLLDEYKDVISFIETGLVGCWGEQWGGKYTSLSHKSQLLNKFMEITPLSIPLMIRTPNTFREWLKNYCNVETTADDMTYSIDDENLSKQAARVGLYNDGYMGSDSDLGTFSNRNAETEWISDTPSYGGEFSGNDEWRLKFSTWLPQHALPEMYRTKLLRINGNIIRTHNTSEMFDTREEAEKRLDSIAALYSEAGLAGYDYNGTAEETSDGYKASWKWIGYDDFTFNKELDDSLGLSCDNSAFYGENVWQFIRAHLGYRFVLKKSELSSSADPGGEFTLRFTVENTGFSDAPSDKEAEVILKKDDISYTFTTDINAKEWKSGHSSKQILNLSMPETIQGGEWNVYLRISDINEDSSYDSFFCTRFANNNLQYDEAIGANLLGSITITGEPRPEKIKYPDTKPSGIYMNSNPISINEENTVNFLDSSYIFRESGHYGFTFIYKASGINEPLQLGNWYTEFKVTDTNYSSAYTTYGINTLNLELAEDGYYAMHIPFFGCAFNCQESSAEGITRLSALNINDSRNYWSNETFTSLKNNTDFKITPVAFIEGGYSGYDITFHLPQGDVNYKGSYDFQDILTQKIQNTKTVTALSILDKECPAEYTDENGIVYYLAGYTTKKDDKSCIINENFPAMGKIHLYPYYEPDMKKTDTGKLLFSLTNGKDFQGVGYILNDDNMTASVGDGSCWENNSGYPGTGSVIIPGMVQSGQKLYSVTKISDRAFYDYVDVVKQNISLKLSDAVILQKYLSGIKELTAAEKLRIDADHNQRLNIMDLVLVKSELLKQ